MPQMHSQDLLPLLKGELLHHQLQGVKWLASLYASGLSGIISDEVDRDRRVSLGQENLNFLMQLSWPASCALELDLVSTLPWLILSVPV